MSKSTYKIDAAVLTSIKHPLEIKKLNTTEIGQGQVLVKIFYSGVCRSQLMEVQGKRGRDNWLPHLLGHEASGQVLSIGKGVTKVRQGDDVILTWIKGDGLEGDPAKYYEGSNVINSGHVTTFSNYAVVSENRLVKKPKGLSFELAMLFGCALPTGGGMVINEDQITQDSVVCVIGLGGIGLSSLLVLKSMGVQKLIACDISDKKLSFAKELGASLLINTAKEDLVHQIHKKYGIGADFCFESGGSVNTIELGFSTLSNNGKLIFASHPPAGEKISIDPHQLISGKKIVGSWGGGTNPDKDIRKLWGILKGNKNYLKKLITKKYKLNEINKALDDLDKGIVFRPLIEMEHD